MQLMAADVGGHQLAPIVYLRVSLYLFSTENWGFHFVSSALICVHLRRKNGFFYRAR
jgi:hypothetical protein